MTQRHRNSNEISKGISCETCAKRYTCKDREIIWLKSPRMVLICDDYKETEKRNQMLRRPNPIEKKNNMNCCTCSYSGRCRFATNMSEGEG